MDHGATVANDPVETPVEVLITGQADTDPRTESDDIRSLRAIASQAMDIVRQSPGISVLRDDWSPDSPQMKIEIDPDRANLVGITNADLQPHRRGNQREPVGIYKEGNKNIPMLSASGRRIARGLSQIENLTSTHPRTMSKSFAFGATLRTFLRRGGIRRREQFPHLIHLVLSRAPGVLASEVLAPIDT